MKVYTERPTVQVWDVWQKDNTGDWTQEILTGDII